MHTSKHMPYSDYYLITSTDPTLNFGTSRLQPYQVSRHASLSRHLTKLTSQLLTSTMPSLWCLLPFHKLFGAPRFHCTSLTPLHRPRLSSPAFHASATWLYWYPGYRLFSTRPVQASILKMSSWGTWPWGCWLICINLVYHGGWL